MTEATATAPADSAREASQDRALQPASETSAGSTASSDEKQVNNALPEPTAAPPAPQAVVPGEAPEAGRTKLQTTLIIAALGSGMFLAALDMTIVTVAIPTITEEFNSTSGYTWIGSAYMLTSAAAAPMWGKISDIWGRKPVLLIAAAVFWVGSLLSAVSVNMSMLIAGRAIQGIGGGGILILVNICISDLFSMRKRGIYFGIMGMVWALAGGVGPVLGGVFTSRVTWRWCFYVNLPISGVGMAILTFVLKLHNPRTSMREGLASIDWLGSLTIVGGTLMLLLGLQLGGVTFPWNSATVICLIVFGVLVIGIFAIIEWKVAKFPVIPMRLFKVPSNIASLAVCAFHGIVFISGSYYLPLYFQAVLGATPLLSGVYVLPYTLSLALTSAGTGVFIKRTGKYLPCIIFGMTVLTLGFGLFIDLEPTTNWAKIIVFQIIAGIGVGPNFQAPLISLQSTVAPRDIASATATFGFIRQLSTSISVVLGGVVFQNGMQKQHDELVSQLGPDIADLLTGGNAAASVGAVDALPEPGKDIARTAYFNSLRTMYIMYVAFSAAGMVVSFFVGSRTLSKDHEEHKTGLQNMARRDQAPGEKVHGQGQGTSDEEKAISVPDSGALKEEHP